MIYGATYDFCRVTLAFDIREGETEGTDITGRKGGVDRRHPKIMTEGTGGWACMSTTGLSDEQFDKWSRCSAASWGGPMAALAPLVGEIVGRGATIR